MDFRDPADLHVVDSFNCGYAGRNEVDESKYGG